MVQNDGNWSNHRTAADLTLSEVCSNVLGTFNVVL